MILEKIFCLEEKLCEEKSKNNILEQDNTILSEKINEEKANYCLNLKKFREEIKRLKMAQQNNFIGNNINNNSSDVMEKEIDEYKEKLK